MSYKRGLYAYGLVGALPRLLDIPGIDKRNNVYPIQAGAICVMVSEIDIDEFQSQAENFFSTLTTSTDATPDEAGDLLHVHEYVVDTLMQNTTVVPLKFGTILKDENAAVKMLQDDEEQFKGLLVRFAGKAEWGLKVYADYQACTKQVMQLEPGFKNMEEQRKTASQGHAYLLGKKIEAAVKDSTATWLATITEDIFQTLGKDACEAKIQKTMPKRWTGKKTEMVLNAAYLLKREQATDFYELGNRLRDRYKAMELDLEVSGPWPPYSFI